MKCNREAEIIACCQGIIRNAKKITENMELDQDLEIRITLGANEAPEVEVKKTFLPKELIDVWNGGMDGE